MLREDSPPLTRAEAVAALRRYVDGAWSASDLARWADDNEMTRHYEDGDSTVIADLLFELSAPEINGPITTDRAREWLSALMSAEHDGER